MERLATPQQIARIVQMYASKQLPFEATQEFIRSHSSKKRRPKAAPVDRNLAFWEERYPGKGEAIIGVLRPFYGWKPELKPALPDLEARAKEAIFWREIKGVRVFQMADAVSLPASLPASLWDSLWCSLRDSLGNSLWNSLRDSLRDSLRASFEASLWASLRDSLRASLRDSLWYSLWYSLFFPCGFILADRSDQTARTARLKPLLDLWLAGNFPMGFDKDGNLLVLVAD